MIPRKERKVFSRKERKDFADFAWNKTLAKVQFKEVSSKNNLSQKVESVISVGKDFISALFPNFCHKKQENHVIVSFKFLVTTRKASL